ncbi:MAG: hypothetical protein J7513_02295 [Solirubrobacteraceae bacterium]|nr:hypothetical protein [Solirubrobacteraceae bacterium]
MTTTPPPNLDADALIQSAPLPTRRTLRRRASLPLQVLRFGVLNVRMLRMVGKGHGDTRE